jgi:hypothetical protein
VTLLQDWPLIKHHRPKAELVVTYGWGHFDAATRGDEDAQRFKGEVAELMRQDGVTYAGALDEGRLRDLLRQARWWVHPLNNPDGGLFCLSAVKAQLFNALPVVLHADDSGLADTVADYVPYAEWTRGNDLVIKRGAPAASAVSWEALVRQFWQPLLERKLDTTG